MAEDELARRREAERGVRAKALVEDQLVKDAFDSIEADIVKAWQDSPPGNAEGRERLYALVWAMKQLRTNLETMITTGHLAQVILSRAQNKGKAA